MPQLAQAAWPAVEKDCAGQSFVARGPPVCFGQPRAAQLSSPLYKQLRKTAGQSCRTSTNGQFFARSSPLQAVSEEKDSAGQSFVARGPPACFGQPRAASAKLAPIQAASQDSRAKLSHKDSFLHEARPCKPCRKRKAAQGKASWPAGHLRASHSPGPPQLSSPLYKQPT